MMENLGEENLEIDNSYRKIVPTEWLAEKGYRSPSEVFLTTFSLDMQQLRQLLYELDALDLVGEKKVHVFYDESARSSENSEMQILSSEVMHGISIHGFAFHPKVILLRYENQTGKTGYVVIVASRNITRSKNLDAYAVACGVVGEQIEKNGERFSEFWKNVFAQDDFSDSTQYRRILEELKKVKFKQPNSEREVKFLSAEEVGNQLKTAKHILMVSPFLSENLSEYLGEGKIDLVVSTPMGLAGIKQQEHVQYRILVGDKKGEEGKEEENNNSLHAKIYCYQDSEGQINWIFGSSNATVNGCNLNGKSENIEYNIGFEGEEEDYNYFRELLSGKEFCDWEQKEEEPTKTINLRKVFQDYLTQMDIICEKNENNEEEPYQVTFKRKKECGDEKYKIEILPADSSASMSKKIADCVVSKKVIAGVKVKIGLESESKSFYLDLYRYWKPEMKKQLDDQCRKNLCELFLFLQKKELMGKKTSQILSLGSDENRMKQSGDLRQRNYEDKRYVFEAIIDIYQREQEAENREVRLRKIRDYANAILRNQPGNLYQEDMKEIVDKIIGEEHE